MELVETLMNRPNLPTLLEEVQEKLEEEQKRRASFYEDITPNDKAEFILGEAIFHSPVKSIHNQVTFQIAQVLDAYVRVHNLGRVGIEKLLISLTRNDYEPDICFFKKEVSDKFNANQMQFPAPDLVVEVLSKSTEERDRGIKFEDYALHGVQEYWIVDPDAKIVEQYIAADGAFRLKAKAGNGTLASEAISDLKLPVEACFDGMENLKVLRGILATNDAT